MAADDDDNHDIQSTTPLTKDQEEQNKRMNIINDDINNNTIKSLEIVNNLKNESNINENIKLQKYDLFYYIIIF